MSKAAPVVGRDRYLLLAPSDNVVVLTRHAEAGETISGSDGCIWPISARLDAGNKLAARAIERGEKVIKLGFVIGTATRAIGPGEHVHSHNLRSDQIPTTPEEVPSVQPD